MTVEEIEARMRPGAFSRSGFLGLNERLAEVISADAKALSALHISCAELAAKLDELVGAAEASPTRRARVGALECQVQVHQGFQICPWTPDPHHAQCDAGLGVRHASVDWHITNVETAEQMKGPGLVIHLIRDHAFFEGPMSPNRVDPLHLARVLGKLPNS
ncbi:MAG TPA: hypothetical protein VKG21_23735 [Casimicrobiaceae bacterium]|nr:hypothetical protein [Casimicrobiaceae bacterium]